MVGDGRGEHEVEGDTNCDGKGDGMAISIKNVVYSLLSRWSNIKYLGFSKSKF